MRRTSKLTGEQRQELEATIRRRGSGSAEVRRAQAVLLVNDETASSVITTLTGYSRRHAFALRRAYLRHGKDALRDKRQGNPRELLTKRQRDAIVGILREKTPEDFQYEREHWTTTVLGDLIERQYGVRYQSKTSERLLFRQATFTYHKPGRVYRKRDAREAEKWRTEAKKRLATAWPDPRTVVLAEDEMILSTQTTTQKVWLPRGEYPKVTVSNERQKRSVYGFLNMKTGREYAFKTERQTMNDTVRIVRRIRRQYPTRKILLLWDGARWHHGSAVQAWLRSDPRVEVFPFPRYAPEENPQEHVWKAGRSHVTHNRFLADIDDATDDFVRYLNTTTFPYALLGFSAVS